MLSKRDCGTTARKVVSNYLRAADLREGYWFLMGRAVVFFTCFSAKVDDR